MTRRILLLAAIVLPLAACASVDKQWYKPGGNYTLAEFQQDRAACTKDKVVDEDCLKGRGWTAISADEDKGPAPIHGGPLDAKRRNPY